MAEFLWTFAVQEVLKKTVKLAAEQMGLAWGFKKELSELRDSLLMVQAILRDVDKIKADLDSLKLWVKKLEDIVLEADILLDELTYEDIRRKVETEKSGMVSNFDSFSNNSLAFRLKMANKITDVVKKLDEHYSRKGFVGFVTSTSKELDADLSQIVETDSFIDEIGVIGRGTEVSDILNKLFSIRSQESLVVFPIVGTGGLGKTALAKEVFHHEMILKNFDTTIWVCVSYLFNVNNILRAIVGTFNANFGGSNTREVILQELKKWLSDKKYFLVLDDVWNEKLNLWNQLRACLLKINQNVGSVIVVTTRSDEVAKIMETHYRHHLRQLPDDDCWSLFEKCAFGSKLPIIPNRIREELVKKFGGIPLVVKVLGGMVKSCKNDEELQSTLENLMGIALQDENQIFSIIELSIDRLPSSSLKQCFAYCSNFPQDFRFYKETLVQMWIAQGFIQLPIGSNIMMEEIGATYFDILLSRSLFQDVVKDERGKIEYCKMHDLIHDVSRTILNHQNVRWDLKTDGKTQGDEVLSTRQRIRTMYYDGNVPSHRYYKIINFIYLRVLVIGFNSIHQLPNSIHKLKHLRYLDISESALSDLSESIVLLYHLQTLKLGVHQSYLPTKLRKLINLRHLEFSINYEGEINQMPQHLSRLTQLQTLSYFIVGCDEGCKIDELGPLKDLKGKLSLLCLERVKSKKEAMAANLKEKKHISYLYFGWSEEREDCNDNDLNVLEGLQPHKNLQTLEILNFAGELLPNGIFVENLVELHLSFCTKCETLPMLGQLCKLEVLEIIGLSNVKSIGDEFYGNYRDSKTLFPQLKTFKLQRMNSLEKWEEVDTQSICTIHKLRSLQIYYRAKLTKLPNWLESCSSLEDLDIGGFISPPNLQNIPNLSSLTIKDLQKLPEGLACLPNLKKFEVRGPMEGYDWSPFIHFNSLEVLKLDERGTNCLTHLPPQLEHLTALRSLHIENFNGIESLPEWLGNVTSLETLKLYDCKNLKNLPSREVMSNLTKLNHLDVYDCSQLDLGEDSVERAKISHVSHIRAY